MATLGVLTASLSSLQLAYNAAAAITTSTTQGSNKKKNASSLGSRLASHNGVSLQPALRIASSSSSLGKNGRCCCTEWGLRIQASSAAAAAEVAEDEGLDLEAYTKSVLPGGFAAARLWGTGRRKSAVARVVLVDGTGKIFINNQFAQEYLQGNPLWLQAVKYPLASLGYESRYDTIVRVQGGGLSGQAQAILLGIARALIVANQANRDPLKKQGLLTRDSRVVERKKYGLKKARKAPQFSKR